MIECSLWLPDVDGKFDAVYVTSIDNDEWIKLRDYFRVITSEFPALAQFSGSPFPIRLAPSEFQAVSKEVNSLDWDQLPTSVLSGMALISGLFHQATQQNSGIKLSIGP